MSHDQPTGGPPARAVDASIQRRLAFIKYLYQRGLAAAAQPEPLSSAALLDFHDAAELFLQLAAEFVDAKTKTTTGFLEYWEPISQKSGMQLAHHEAMVRLNRARINVKHAGVFVSRADIDSYTTAIEAFLFDNSQQVFGIDFEALSMIDVLPQGPVRDGLRMALTTLDSGDVTAAISQTAVAFATLIDDYEMSKLGRRGRSPFFFGRDMTLMTSSQMNRQHLDRRTAQFLDAVKESVEAMQQAVKLLSLGLDYRRYARFRLLTPTVHKVLNGPYRVISMDPSEPPSRVDAIFCIDFVAESALRLAEFDFQVDPPVR